MKRYALFIGQEYYPGGGMEDFDSTSDNLEELVAKGAAHPEISYPKYYWSSVWDMQELKEVWNKEEGYIS